jgi:hypothetical protein
MAYTHKILGFVYTESFIHYHGKSRLPGFQVTLRDLRQVKIHTKGFDLKYWGKPIGNLSGKGNTPEEKFQGTINKLQGRYKAQETSYKKYKPTSTSYMEEAGARCNILFLVSFLIPEIFMLGAFL